MDSEKQEFKFTENDIVGLVSSNGFSDLPENIQDKILNCFQNNQEKDGGLMGKLFGNRNENASINIAFAVCMLLAIVGLVCMISGNECWNIIVTGIMTTVGYIFGRGTKD